MNEKDVIRAALDACGWSRATLAEKAGYAGQTAITNRLHGKSMRVDTFVRLLDVMGYEIVVKSKSAKNKNVWTVDHKDDGKKK